MLALFQRREEHEAVENDDGTAYVNGVQLKAGFNQNFLSKETVTPYVIMCATMWHENDREMVQILHSIIG